MLKDVVLSILWKKLHLAIYETYQLDPKEISTDDYLVHCEKLVRNIAKGKVKSPHLSKEEAMKFINFIDNIYK